MLNQPARGSYMVLTAPLAGGPWRPRLQIPDANYEEIPKLRPGMDGFIDSKVLGLDLNQPLMQTAHSLHGIIERFVLALRSSPDLCDRWNTALTDASRAVDLGFLAESCQTVDRHIVYATPDDPAVIVHFILKLHGAGLFSVTGESFPLVASGFGNVMGRVILISALVATDHAIDSGVFQVFLENFVISHELDLEGGMKPSTGLERRLRMRYEPRELFGSQNPEDLGVGVAQFVGQLSQPEGILETIARGRDITRMNITRVTDERYAHLPDPTPPWPERLQPLSTNYGRLRDIISRLV